MKDTKKGIAEQSEMGLSLEDLIRRGARQVIQAAIEVEVQQLLAEYGNVEMLGGQRAVVRNGYLPAREVLTAVGNVEVRVPKVRDRSGAGIKFNSVLVPPFVRRSQRVAAALPWLYLKGISTGDMREALTVLVGDQAKGLSANVVSRLKSEWASEYYLAPLGITSMLEATVRRDGRLIGVVCHEHVGPPRNWLQDEKGFAASIADMVAIVLEAEERRRLAHALEESEDARTPHGDGLRRRAGLPACAAAAGDGVAGAG